MASDVKIHFRKQRNADAFKAICERFGVWLMSVEQRETTERMRFEPCAQNGVYQSAEVAVIDRMT